MTEYQIKNHVVGGAEPVSARLNLLGLPGTLSGLTHSSNPTPHLRFIKRGEKRILQQEWCIDIYAHNGNRSRSMEWRDVPLVDDGR